MRPTLTNLLMLLLLVVLLTVQPQAVRAESANYKRTVERYQVPDVVLVDQNGKKVRLKSLLESNRPVVVDFIYGTCTTICPVLSAGYANLQRKLGAESARVQLVSITIDPENDSPKVLKEYLQRYQAKPGWSFLTGSRRDIDRVMHAFNAYFRNKMEHQPLTFIRGVDGTWIRLYGLISSTEFMNEYKKTGLK